MPDALQIAIIPITARTTIGQDSIPIVDRNGDGFDPMWIKVFWNEQTAYGAFSSHAIMSHGWATKTTEQFAACASMKDATVSSSVSKRRQTASHLSIVLDQDGGIPDMVVDLYENFGTGTPNTVVLDYVTVDGSAYVGQLVAIGGSAVSAAKVGTFVPATQPNSVDVTGLSGTPNTVFFMSAGHTANDSTQDNASIHFGWHGPTAGVGANRAHSVSMVAEHNVGTTNAGSMLHSLYQVIESIKSGAPAVACDFAVTAYASGQFTVQTATVRAAAYIVGYLAITIEGSKTSLHAAPTATGIQNGPSLTFTPRLVITLSAGQLAKSVGETPSDDASYSIGFANGDTEGAIWAGMDDGDTTSEADQRIESALALAVCGYGSPTLQKGATCTAMASTWTLDFTTADATARDYAALTLGEKTPSIWSYNDPPMRKKIEVVSY